jgi:uncharacterized protein YbjT (DUF2867 family)
MNRTAIIIGSSGLVGKQLLNYLLQDTQYNLITIIVRKSLNWKHPKLKEVITDFNNLDSLTEYLITSDLFICTGTTIKKAGSKAAFKKIDLELPYSLSKIAIKNNVENLYIISALGANSRSQVYYNAIKGELEDLIKQLSFKKICIFQPSLLLGKRSEFRLTELIAQYSMRFLNIFMIGPLANYKGVYDWQVAKAMQINSHLELLGVHVIANNKMVCLEK